MAGNREAWLASDANRYNEQEGRHATASPKTYDTSTGTASPPKMTANSVARPMPYRTQRSQATLSTSKRVLRQASPRRRRSSFPVRTGVPIDNDDTLHGLFRDLQKRCVPLNILPVTRQQKVCVSNDKLRLMIPISKPAQKRSRQIRQTLSSALAWATSDVANKDSRG
jgi:hypothetical protein